MSDSGNSLTWIVVVAVIAVLAVSAILFLNEPNTDEDAIDGQGQEPETSVTTSETDSPTPPPEEEPGELTTEDISGEQRETIAPEGLYFSGRVIDDTTEEPIRKFRLSLVRMELPQQKGVRVVEADVKNEEGQFSFPLEKGGLHNLVVWVKNYHEKRIYDLEIPSDLGLRNHEVRMDTPLDVVGRVVDDATALPVEGATVGGFMAGRREFIPNVDKGWGFKGHNKTDSEGRFILSIPSRWRIIVVALHPDFAEGFCETTAGEEEVEIRLKKSNLFVFGTVSDDNGEPAKGIEIHIKGETLPCTLITKSDEKGAYKSPWLLPGELEITAFPIGSEKDDSVEITRETKWVSLVDRPLEVNFGPSPEYTDWIGTLYDTAGRPAAGGSVFVRSEMTIAGTSEPIIYQKTKCDETGRFKIRKLVQGRYRVFAVITGKNDGHAVIDAYMEFDEPGIVHRDLHSSGAEINGIVIKREDGQPMVGARVTALPKSDTGKLQAATAGRDGRFCLINLLSGNYTLLANGRGPNKYYSGRLDDFEIVDGQVIYDVRIVLECNGYLLFKITEAGEPDPPRFKVSMQNLDRKTSNESGTLFKAETWSYRRHLEPGNWILKIESDELGIAERLFSIVADEETKVIVRGSDFKK